MHLWCEAFYGTQSGLPAYYLIDRDGDDADWQSNPLALEIERRTVTAADTLVLPLAAGGGAAIRLEPRP